MPSSNQIKRSIFYQTKQNEKKRKGKEIDCFYFYCQVKTKHYSQKFGKGVLSARALLPPAGQQSFPFIQVNPESDHITLRGAGVGFFYHG